MAYMWPSGMADLPFFDVFGRLHEALAFGGADIVCCKKTIVRYQQFWGGRIRPLNRDFITLQRIHVLK